MVSWRSITILPPSAYFSSLYSQGWRSGLWGLFLLISGSTRSKERGWEDNTGIERVARAGFICGAGAPGTGWAHKPHPCERQESPSCCWSPWDLRYLLCMTLPTRSKIQGWFRARSVMSVCFIKGQADHFCPALTLCRFIKHSVRSLSLDRKFMPKVSLMPNTTW